MFGEAFFILKINLPPTDGNCSIQPESGIAFITNFQVICQGFKDVDIPIKYSVIQDELLVVQSQDKEFNLRLNKMEDEFIQIKVEDSYGAFSLEKLKVSVDSLKKDEIMKIFTKNLSDLVQMNDLSAAVTLINLAIPEINEDDVEKTGEIVDAFLKLHYPTVPSIKLVLGSLKNLSAKFILAHDVRRKISEVFDKISSSLDLLLKFPNKMQLEDVELISQNVLKITNKLVVPFEMMLPQNQLPESSKKLDDYPDYEEFDEEIEDKMYNLNQVAESTNSLLQKVSRLFLLAMKAEEPNINITLENSTFIFKTVDINNKISLEFDDKTKIEMNEEFMDDFKKNHGNVLSLSILSYEVNLKNLVRHFFEFLYLLQKNNPFWFNNLQDQQKSSVFTLEIFDEICQKTQYFGIPFEFSSEFNEIKTREIHFQIQPTNDMPVFEIVFPKNSKLLVNFTSSDFPIKVLEKFNRRPQFKEMLKDYKIFPTETGDTHFYLDKKNVNRSRDELIFLGILSVAAVPSNISMTISILSCNSWDAAIRDWSNKICMPLTLNGTSLKCSCSGPSTFQSTIFAAQHKLDPRRETLYAIEGNWIVLSTVIILVAIFVLSLLWAWKRDKEEKLCRKIVYLKSNRPDDQIVYLLTLETGEK